MTKYPFAPRVNPDGTAKPETDEEFHERVVACLERLDSMDRLERAERHIWMGKIPLFIRPPPLQARA